MLVGAAPQQLGRVVQGGPSAVPVGLVQRQHRPGMPPGGRLHGWVVSRQGPRIQVPDTRLKVGEGE